MRRSIIIFCSIFTVFFALLLTGCNGGPGVHAYYRGNTAYENGDYQTAFENYLYAANQDVVPAQYAVGYQYYYGIGTKRDESEGIKWLERAAYFSPRAQYALHLIQENRPPQPWMFQLKDAMQPKVKNPAYGIHNACVVSVKCVN